MTAHLLVQAASMLLVLAFALLLGAQIFDAFVNQPVFLSDPPDSIRKYLEYATARRVPAYFRRVVILVIVATLAAIAACVAMRGPPALLVSTACAVFYIALIFLFFLPTNRKLGFLSAAPGTPPTDAQGIVRLSRQWQTWDRVRIAVQFVGLISAVLAFSALK
jgi:hypothetical protein